MTGRRLSILAAGLLLVVSLAGAGAMFIARQPAQADQMRAGAYDPPQAAPEFSLRGSDGSELSLARYRGKVVLVSFGFTYCAAVCPTTLSTLAQARSRLGKNADSVQVIFVTVDPARDDPVRLQEYVAAFDSSFVGATGTTNALADARKAYGVTAVKEGTGPDYAMAHTSSIFLIDREGKLRAMMPFGHDPGDFVHDIELLLKA